MKTYIKAFILCLTFSSCGLFVHDKPGNEADTDPPYTAKIAWDSGLYSNYYQSHMVDGDSVFFYERPPGYDTVNIYALTRLDAETGRIIWRSNVLFREIVFCQPVVIGNYVYVFLMWNVILCFDRETGENTARVLVDIDNKGLEFMNFATAYQDYLYLSLWTNGRYFVRFAVNLIDQSGGTAMQNITPEILWEPETGGYVYAKPVVYNNVVYTGTNINIQGVEGRPVEVAGFDIDTKEMVFHVTFGGPEDIGVNARNIEKGIDYYPIFIHDDILYYLSTSIVAWDIRSGERLYRHVFTNNTPVSKLYFSNSLQPVYYKGNIYYTGSAGDEEWRNIICINAATGELVWNASSKKIIYYHTNPIITHGKLYIADFHGLRVYNAENGELLGVDKSFCGTGTGRNVLYNDYMICVRDNRDTGEGKLVAVYVGE